VGPETADDAGVYRIGANLALVETVDIITPLVDDPWSFGRIAAANALSDVYAMGGKPVTAMNLVFFPACSLDGSVLRDILAGGLSAVAEAGACLVGGHTVEDDELKYGLSVTGLMDPERVVRNSTARPGDRLVLTKPIGSGIVATAVKADMADPAAAAEVSRWLCMLNAEAARLMMGHNPSAATDITGFGLLGHVCEMAAGAGVTVRLQGDRIPFFPTVFDLIRDGLVPAGCYRNRDHYSPRLRPGGAGEEMLIAVCDPQTSGGLLMAFAPADAAAYLAAAEGAGCYAVEVGEVLPASGYLVEFA
jgi:selenide,water dikinase